MQNCLQIIFSQVYFDSTYRSFFTLLQFLMSPYLLPYNSLSLYHSPYRCLYNLAVKAPISRLDVESSTEVGLLKFPSSMICDLLKASIVTTNYSDKFIPTKPINIMKDQPAVSIILKKHLSKYQTRISPGSVQLCIRQKRPLTRTAEDLCSQ